MDEPGVYFSGILVRAAIADEHIDLFFHPWSFEPDVEARPILVARLNRPAFPAADIHALLNEGFDADFYPDRIDAERDSDHAQFELKADSVSLTWQAYGAEDYADFARTFRAHYNDESQRHSQTRRRVEGAVKRARELIRRAEAKGQLSSEMKARQAEAVRVLERMIAALEG